MKETGTHHRGLLAGFSPLAGVSAGTAAVLFAFGVLALAWHQVSGHVSLAITILAYMVIAALAVVTGAGTWLVVLWVAHRHRNPELLVRRADRAQVLDAEPAPEAVAATAPPAIEPPRLYFTDDQFAAILRRAEGK
jgi:apolipoprotein N-acyltransferase